MTTRWDLEFDAPPDALSIPQQALWWLRKGNLKLGPAWDQAHVLCQQQEGTLEYDLVHALAHWIEGDLANRDYWYRRVGGGRMETPELEWQRIADVV